MELSNETIMEMNIDKIKEYIKIRYPVLMIDYAKVEPGKRAEGYKLLTGNEPFWQGHYPEYPMFPGSYQLEALSQLFSLTFLTMSDKSEIPKLAGFESTRFFKEVVPGKKYEMQAELDSFRHGLAKGNASAYVEGICVCSTKIKIVYGGMVDV